MLMREQNKLHWSSLLQKRRKANHLISLRYYHQWFHFDIFCHPSKLMQCSYTLYRSFQIMEFDLGSHIYLEQHEAIIREWYANCSNIVGYKWKNSAMNDECMSSCAITSKAKINGFFFENSSNARLPEGDPEWRKISKNPGFQPLR